MTRQTSAGRESALRPATPPKDEVEQQRYLAMIEWMVREGRSETEITRAIESARTER